MTAKKQRDALRKVLSNPVEWGQHFLKNRDGSARTYWPHQVDDLMCDERNVVHQDGRDLGKCLSGETRIMDLDSGERIRIDRLKEGRRIAVFDTKGKLATASNYQILRNGRKPVFKVGTGLGRQITATSHHPLLSAYGWRRLGQLRPGSWIAVPRQLPSHGADNPGVSDDQLKLLAYFIADGSLTGRSLVFTKTDPLISASFELAVQNVWPWQSVKRFDRINYRVINNSTINRNRLNACRIFLERHGILGCRSEKKFVPDAVFTCSRRQIAVFLRALMGCDGWFALKKGRKTLLPEVGFCSASEVLTRGVGHLLLRLGIIGRLRSRTVKGRPYFIFEIKALKDILRFSRIVGLEGEKGTALAAFASQSSVQPSASDLIPGDLVGSFLHDIDHPLAKQFKRQCKKSNPRRSTVAAWADQFNSAALRDLTNSDLFWDRITAIESIGEQETYDLSVPGYRNFVADDVLVHNSICLTTHCLHFAFTNRGGKGLIAAPHQGQLDTISEEIEWQIEHNKDLAASIAKTRQGQPKITRKPYFRVEFTNGSILYFRPAGVNGESFRSLHVNRIWADEAAWLSERAWKALRQCLITGGKLRIYSTPNGMRNTTYYRLTTENNTFKVFKWPSWLSPLWTDERERDLLEFYGGRDSAGWHHEVAGDHGKPSYSAFNIDALNACRRDLPEYRRIVITGAELADAESEEEVHDRLELLLGLDPAEGEFWVGGDLGYTNDPTELTVFRETKLEGKSVLSLVLRVHMEHVAYPSISQTIALLDHYFNPAGIGVDFGGNGTAVVQELLSLDKYRNRNFPGRLEGVHFGGVTTVPVRDGQIKKRTKEYMTNLINGGFQRRELLLPATDNEIEDEFTTHTYVLRDGKVIYSKGQDHIIDSIRCAVLVRDRLTRPQDVDSVTSVVPIATKPVFI